MKRAAAEKMCEHITDSVRTVMKAWDESLHPRDENGRFTSGVGSTISFNEYTVGNETWYEAELDGGVRARVREEEVGNGWWTAELADPHKPYEWLRDSNNYAMTFETPEEAMAEIEYELAHGLSNTPKQS